MATSKATRFKFAQWYVRDQLERSERWGMDCPSSINGWAREHDIASRTLRRWLAQAESGQDDEFAELLERAEAERAAGIEKEPPTLPDGLGGSDIEREFGQVKGALLEKARSGDVQAMKVWLSEFGASLVEQERQALESDLAGVSDDELIRRVRTLVVQLEGLLVEA